MNVVKEMLVPLYKNIKGQIVLLENIKKGDKIYYTNGLMYLQYSTIFQSVYRSITGENRELTFKYLESFIGNFINLCDQTKRVVQYIQDIETRTIVTNIPLLKKKILNILKVLKETYPTNISELDSLYNFIQSSC